MATFTANTTESITLADAPKATSVSNNTYLFLNQGVAKSFSTVYQSLDLFKIDSKFDVNESGSVKVYKSLTVDKNLTVTGNNTINGTAKVIQSLEVSKNLIVTGNTTISGILNIIPPGVIVMWSGSVATIPSGWVLCNGSNGTPDLRDRFVIGAGSTYAVANTGGSKDAVAVSHTHTATSTVTDPGHAHDFNTRGDDGQGAGAGYSVVGYNANIGAGTGNMSSATTGVTVATTVNSTGSSGTNANLPPYYALCFIMKS
jgi:hypothetical protein